MAGKKSEKNGGKGAAKAARKAAGRGARTDNGTEKGTATGIGSGDRNGDRNGDGFRLLTDRQRTDLLGLALAALALFMGLSLMPATGAPALPALVGDAGPAGGAGNPMGVVGAAFADAGRAFLGAGIFLIPLIPALGALAAFGVRRDLTARWAILIATLALLLPVAAGVAVGVERALAWAGWWGVLVGAPLTAGLGTLGAAMMVLFVAIAASIATIGWNPARSAAGGASAGARALKGAVGAVGTMDPESVARPARRVGGLFRRRPKAARLPDDAPGFAPSSDVVLVPEEDAAPGDGGRKAKRKRGRKGAAGGAGAGSSSDGFEGPMTAGPGGAAPPVTLLAEKPPRDPALTEQELDRLAGVLVATLETFKVQGEIVGRTTGPVVTQYEFAPAPGVKVSRVEALDADLALALKAPSVRIVAPIPGKAAVGVEVPNPAPDVVFLREIVDSPAFRRGRGELPLALGKDLEGGAYVADLARMPHLLIAGATGSGKSVCINTIITSLVFRHSPETLRLLMVDPKMVELSMYGDLPHLRHPVVTDPEDAALVLRWAVYEMERRYELLSQNNVRSIAEFNNRVSEGGVLRRAEPKGPEGDPDRWIYDDGRLPYVVVIVDELADLMLSVQSEIERPLAQLAQKARAIGIHLIVATQRPSVNVITGLIKANFPCRIGFRVSSKVDSRTILDQNGADALLGNGDMLFLPPGTSDPVRIQGAFISTEETERLMKWYRERAKEEDAGARAGTGTGKGEGTGTGTGTGTRPGARPGMPDEQDILEYVRARDAEAAGNLADDVLEDRDDLFRQAAEVCIQHEQGSTSLLQRRLKIGYGRAARIVDQLHHAGILGPPDGSKPREVLIGLAGLDLLMAGQTEEEGGG